MSSLWQGFSDPMRGVAANDAPGLQLAIAMGAGVYVLSDKKRVPRGDITIPTYACASAGCAPNRTTAQLASLGCYLEARFIYFDDRIHLNTACGWVLAGKAAGIVVGGLLAGVLLGAGLQSWLRVDIVPIGVRHMPLPSSAFSAMQCT